MTENSQENSEPDTSKSLHAVVSDEMLTNYLVAEVVEKVDSKIRQRESFRNKLSGIVFTVLGLVGIAGIYAQISSEVTERFKESAPSREIFVEQTAKRIIDERLRESNRLFEEKIAREALLQQFTFSVLSFELNDASFQTSERASIMTQLEQLRTDRHIRARASFIDLLARFVSRIATSDSYLQVRVIAENFSTEASENRILVHAVVEALGKSLIGSAIEPKRWSSNDVDLFQSYLDASKSLGIYYKTLPYEILIEYRRAGLANSQAVENLLENVGYLANAEQKANVIATLTVLCNYRKLSQYESMETRRTQDVCEHFLSHNKKFYALQFLDSEVVTELSRMIHSKRNRALSDVHRTNLVNFSPLHRRFKKPEDESSASDK